MKGATKTAPELEQLARAAAALAYYLRHALPRSPETVRALTAEVGEAAVAVAALARKGRK